MVVRVILKRITYNSGAERIALVLHKSARNGERRILSLIFYHRSRDRIKCSWKLIHIPPWVNSNRKSAVAAIGRNVDI